MQLNRDQVMALIYGRDSIRRFTQDSPVLPDVWVKYAEHPREQQDLLITPYVSKTREPLTPGLLSRALSERLQQASAQSPGFRRQGQQAVAIAYNQAAVAATLWFDEMVRVLLPLSSWWIRKIHKKSDSKSPQPLSFQDLQNQSIRSRVARLLAEQDSIYRDRDVRELQATPSLLWTINVVGTIAMANEIEEGSQDLLRPPPSEPEHEGDRIDYYSHVVEALVRLIADLPSPSPNDLPMVHQVANNRVTRVSVWRSSPTVKADAVRNLFKVSCSNLTWAIVDSGIDAPHAAFLRPSPDNPPAQWSDRTRVRATYDFTILRTLLSSDLDLNHLPPQLEPIRERLQAEPGLRQELRARLLQGHDIDWSLLRGLIKIPHQDGLYRAPVHEHGTHVAGILAADWPAEHPDNPTGNHLQGICPDINLYDLRVINDQGQGDEFTVMAALQFIRHLNAQNNYTVIHGVNLSLSIPHDVRNYACGCTPVCEECETLIGDGIVVVAAAGNEGYRLATGQGCDSYQAISITDPGNAEGVITVGATHRDSPHSYGVSYFSSRGPTGDGRIKPDVVAPGEKIESTIPYLGVKPKDGTSMAAPHVSGVAALLMARNRELIGRPQQIKKIICSTATDLGRERYFQGAGLVDALRALQSV